MATIYVIWKILKVKNPPEKWFYRPVKNVSIARFLVLKKCGNVLGFLLSFSLYSSPHQEMRKVPLT
jgi:hypothetical protein